MMDLEEFHSFNQQISIDPLLYARRQDGNGKDHGRGRGDFPRGEEALRGPGRIVAPEVAGQWRGEGPPVCGLG